MKKISFLILSLLLIFAGCTQPGNSGNPPVIFPKFTVTYSTEFGTTPAAIYVEPGHILTDKDLPSLPETEDRYFTGWDVKPGTKITENITITASWKKFACIKPFTAANANDLLLTFFEVTKVEDLPFYSDLGSGKINEIYFTKEAVPSTSTYKHDYKTSDENITFTVSFEQSNGKNRIYVSGNGDRIYIKNCRKLFYCFDNTICNYEWIDLENLYTAKVIDMNYLFGGCSSLTTLNISNFDTSNVTDMSYMFSGCTKLKSIDLSNFNTSNVTDMSFMFSCCEKLSSLDLSSFNTSKVTDMKEMFLICKSLTSVNLTSFDTSNVTDMSYMFSNCTSLTALDFSSFNTSNVSDMQYMFNYCQKLETLDLSKFNTSNVKTMNDMIYECEGLKSINISSFNTEKVKSMARMLYTCKNLETVDISSFNFVNVMDLTNFFTGCEKLKTIYASPDLAIPDSCKTSAMFVICKNLTGGAGTKYSDAEISDPENYNTAVYARIDGGPSKPGYFTAK
ncbi:MAG: BspA family leucine-rich repeat surface protein [Treponema sp.]|nr:BspA family leucine-rich repeat surface protein [Candidatus Treponema merdequi]